MNRHTGQWTSIASAVLLFASLVVGLEAAAAQDPEPDTMVTVEGGGWGHGIGMSQYGAFGRASDGHTHEEILEFYYPGAVLTETDVLDDIRVHLHSGTGTVVTPSPNKGPANDIRIVDGDDNLIFNSINGNKLTIRKVASGGFSVFRSGTNLCIDDDGADRCQVDEINLEFVQGEPVKVDVIDKVSIGTTGNRYQWGKLAISERTLDATGSTLWVVIEDLTMDQYIYGLAEVPASWPTETLKTQAVAGRTFALRQATNRRASGNQGKPWDLFSTVDDQVYHGYEKEIGTHGPTWTAAVDATSREVMLYSGNPIGAFYSSSNGGWTETNGYVWNTTPLPYLIAQKDTYDSFGNPNAIWSRDYTGTEVGTWLNNVNLGSVGSVIDVAIWGDIGDSGRVDRARVTVQGSTGSAEMSGNSFRNAINIGVRGQGGGLSRQILSTKYTVSVLGGEEPVGALDTVTRSGDQVTVTGWVFDPDSKNSVSVEIRVDGVVVDTTSAGQARFDVDAVFNEGQRRGFQAAVTMPDGDKHQVCAYAHNVGPGDRLLLGCKAI